MVNPVISLVNETIDESCDDPEISDASWPTVIAGRIAYAVYHHVAARDGVDAAARDTAYFANPADYAVAE